MYQTTPKGNNVRRADGAIIPLDPMNIDYQEYAVWRAQGNTPTQFDPPSDELVAQAALLAQLTPQRIVKILATGDNSLAVQLDAQIEAAKLASVSDVK